jgi:hypothetical protein
MGAELNTSKRIASKNASVTFPEVRAPELTLKIVKKGEKGLTFEPEGLLKPTLHQNVQKN